MNSYTFCCFVMRLTNVIQAEVFGNLVHWAFIQKAILTCLPLEAQTEGHDEVKRKVSRYYSLTIYGPEDSSTTSLSQPTEL